MSYYNLVTAEQRQRIPFLLAERRREKAKEADEADQLDQELLNNTSNGDPLKLMFNVPSVPSLQNLTLSKIVVPLINEKLIYISSLYSKKFDRQLLLWPQLSHCIYEKVQRRATEDIRKLYVPCTSSRIKLKNFIATLCYNIVELLETYHRNLLRKDDTYFIIMNNIPQYWLADGTIDLEKFVQLIVESKDIHPMNRFVFACKYCCFEDILNLWELLPETEKAQLRSTSDFIVRSWIEWLESYLNKEWQFCVSWILGTPLWNKNIFVLKRVLGALTPKERNYYLRKTLTQRDVSSNVMQFCRSLVAIDEQLQNFRESPFKSI